MSFSRVPPDWLSDDAADVWYDHVELWIANLDLSATFRAVLGRWCELHVIYRTYKGVAPSIENRFNEFKPNPDYQAGLSAHKEMLSIERAFGLNLKAAEGLKGAARGGQKKQGVRNRKK